MASTGRRRLQKTGLERPAGPSRRVDRRVPRGRRRLATIVRISPAVAGTVVLMAAGLGSVVTSGAGPTDSSRVGLEYVVARPSGSPDGGVDVSRSFDRAALSKQMALQTDRRAHALEKNDQLIVERAEELKLAEERRNQWVLPVASYTLTARFGQRSSLWSSGVHTGLDFAGPSGTKIVAVAAGTVTSAGYSGSYGNRTVITLLDGSEIWYCHQSKIVVKVGDKVSPGQLTGYTGSTGNVTGPHLHLEVRPPGAGPIDPAPALRSHGINP